jgi:diadenosine tetraphosphate (Ap4A) HIT family hydrolase
MGEYRPFDIPSYLQQIRSKPCFVCAILEGRDTTHHVIYRDEVGIAFLSKFPTLYGYVLVAPTRHREHVTGDFTMEEYVALQQVIYKVGEAVRQEVPTERLYVSSLGSQQGNRHVHWHVAPLPPGVPFEEQQLEALSVKTRGYLHLAEEESGELAARLRLRLGQ